MLTALDHGQAIAAIASELISQHGLTRNAARQTCRQIHALMQPQILPAAPDKTNATAVPSPPLHQHLARLLLGTRVDFHSNCDASLQMLAALWDDSFKAAAPAPAAAMRIDIVSSPAGWHVLREGQVMQFATSLPALKSAIVQEVLCGLHQTREWAAVLHAAAVLIDDKLILLAGQSGSGKTTLASALIAHGATFFSDDCVPLRRDTLMACASPGTLGIRPAALAGLPAASAGWQPGKLGGLASDLRHHTSPERMTRQREASVTALVFPSFTAHGTAHLKRLDAHDTLRALLANGSGIDELDATSLSDWLDWIVRTPAWSIHYGHTADGLRYIADILAQSD